MAFMMSISEVEEKVTDWFAARTSASVCVVSSAYIPHLKRAFMMVISHHQPPEDANQRRKK